MSKERLEAFSDGVIAIAVTLLVLNLKVPPVGGRSLGHELARQWPSYVAYAISFLTIGIIWINHHAAAPISAYLSLAICGVIAVYYAVPSPAEPIGSAASP